MRRAKGAVSTRQLTGIGTALVDSSGMTIYTPKQPDEAKDNIKSTGSCLSSGSRSPPAG